VISPSIEPIRTFAGLVADFDRAFSLSRNGRLQAPASSNTGIAMQDDHLIPHLSILLGSSTSPGNGSLNADN